MPENQEGNGIPNGVNLETVQKQWTEFLTTLSSKRPSLGSILEFALPENVQGGKLIISLPQVSNFAVNSLKKNREDIESIIENIIGKALRISYNTNDEIKPVEATDKEDEKTDSDEPVLERMIERFDGELLR